MLQFKATNTVKIFFLLSILIPGILHSESVTLEWNENQETDLAGYRVYYGTEPGNYTKNVDTGNTTIFTLTQLEAELTYYFSLTAYDNSGNESGYSDEIVHTVEMGAEDELLLTPNGGEELAVGSRYNIEWIVYPEVTKITIWFSSDCGNSWTLIKDNTGNDGHWTWDIPDIDSDSCLMRLEEFRNPSFNDVSSACFSIVGGATGIENDSEKGLPRAVALEQNYPNPFNPVTTISFTIPDNEEQQDLSRVTLAVYDSRGRKVKNLVDTRLPAGNHSVCWNGKTDRGEVTPSGIYLYTLTVDNRVLPPRKMVLAR